MRDQSQEIRIAYRVIEPDRRREPSEQRSYRAAWHVAKRDPPLQGGKFDHAARKLRLARAVIPTRPQCDVANAGNDQAERDWDNKQLFLLLVRGGFAGLRKIERKGLCNLVVRRCNLQERRAGL